MQTFHKLIAIDQKTYNLNYISNSLRFELGFDGLSSSNMQTIHHIVSLMETEIKSDPDREVIDLLLALKSKNPQIAQLIESIENNRPIEELRDNIAYKALILVVRNWEKRDWHSHVSDSLDGLFVSKQYGLSLESFDYKTDKYHINDDWIKNIGDFGRAFRYVISQYFEDGVTDFDLRFNPYKNFWGNSHEVKLEKIKETLEAVSAIAGHMETLENKKTGRSHNVRFLFSLDRRKYGQENMEKLLDIIHELIKIKKENPTQFKDRIFGIDISGRELLEWEYESGATPAEHRLFSALAEAKEAGFEIVSHIGDFKQVNQAITEEFGLASDHIHGLELVFLQSYLLESGVSRIGHATAIMPFPGMSENTAQKLDSIVKMLQGQVTPEILTEIVGIDDQFAGLIVKYLTDIGALEKNGKLSLEFEFSVATVNYSFWQTELNNKLALNQRSVTPEMMKNIIELMARISHASTINLERCYYDDISTLKDLRETSPVYFWKRNDINFVLGIDGLVHNTKGSYDYGAKGDYEAVSLSQWIVMLMLAAPAGEGWTIEYLKEKTAAPKAMNAVAANLLHNKLEFATVGTK